MNKIILFLLVLLLSPFLQAQVSGNINYQQKTQFADNNIDIPFSNSRDIILNVKGMSNVKADSYVAIFNLTQVGKTTEEVNSLMDERISEIDKAVKNEKEVTFFVDMISFVPVYEYQVEKKLFSRKTYNEIPKGFELKKNLHIEFKNPNFLNQLIALCADSEIYDLVRVDYISDNLEAKKKELRQRSKAILQEKMVDYQELLRDDLNVYGKDVADGFKVFYPTEMYDSYQAFHNSSLNLKKAKNINVADKTTTLYYQPVIDKEFDFVVNPQIVEPVIQVLYEVKIRIRRDEKIQADKVLQAQKLARPNTPPPSKEYILITPTGDIKTLPIN